MPEKLTSHELIMHSLKCYRLAQALHFWGFKKESEIVTKWAKRAEYRAIQIDSGMPDPAFDNKKSNKANAPEPSPKDAQAR